MPQNAPGLPKYFINIGEYAVHKGDKIIYTLLGSCVSVCLYDAQKKIGGMNHILLPGDASLRSCTSSTLYGINLMELMINEILKKGGSKQRLSAKVFGGANLVKTVKKEFEMGTKNVRFVKEFLQAEKINIISSDTLGDYVRKVFFHTGTGKVYLKKRSAENISAMTAQMRTKLDKLTKQLNKSGSVTLFNQQK